MYKLLLVRARVLFILFSSSTFTIITKYVGLLLKFTHFVSIRGYQRSFADVKLNITVDE